MGFFSLPNQTALNHFVQYKCVPTTCSEVRTEKKISESHTEAKTGLVSTLFQLPALCSATVSSVQTSEVRF